MGLPEKASQELSAQKNNPLKRRQVNTAASSGEINTGGFQPHLIPDIGWKPQYKRNHNTKGYRWLCDLSLEIHWYGIFKQSSQKMERFLSWWFIIYWMTLDSKSLSNNSHARHLLLTIEGNGIKILYIHNYFVVTVKT